jgi:hypothetical protein
MAGVNAMGAAINRDAAVSTDMNRVIDFLLWNEGSFVRAANGRARTKPAVPIWGTPTDES